VLGTGVAIFCIQGLEAAATVGPSLLHDVALAAKHRLALEAAKVFHVPVPSLSFCAFVCKDDLITGCAARLQALGVVPATVYLPILVKVDQIHQQLVADGADEARRVPANAVAGTGRKHGDVPAVNLASALFTDSSCHRDWEGPDIPSTQVFTFPLVAEELQLPLLLLIQGVAVSNLIVMWRQLV